MSAAGAEQSEQIKFTAHLRPEPSGGERDVVRAQERSQICALARAPSAPPAELAAGRRLLKSCEMRKPGSRHPHTLRSGTHSAQCQSVHLRSRNTVQVWTVDAERA